MEDLNQEDIDKEESDDEDMDILDILDESQPKYERGYDDDDYVSADSEYEE
ncbi:hypothetical protein [Helicobacter suis]|uniref:hypothetical protein n=1 Tax=Helicobacter suis TaxID=104628 RepID=UPI0024912CBD|nr:hypothetical protein [Helicobacter suis]